MRPSPLPPPFPRRAVTLANWRTHPFTRWTFQNVAEFVPVAMFGAPRAEPDDGPRLDLRLDLPDLGPIEASDYLSRTHGDAFVATRDGTVLAQWQAPHCDPGRPHLVFSISKSITGMLAGIAVGDGLLDPEAPIADSLDLPEGGAYASGTVRDLLDMTVSVDFQEDYLNLDGAFDRYRRAMLWNPQRAGSTQETLEQVLVSLPKGRRPHGEVFRYASPNTDLMGIVLERATGIRFHDYLRNRLWTPMGATGAAYVTVDGEGTARAAGGICVTARDLARLGELALNGGAVQGRQIVPASWVEDLRHGGRRDAWLDGDFAGLFPRGSYRSYWYAAGDDRGCFAADGIHGQRLWADPVSGVVAVKLSSNPLPTDDQATILDFTALAQIARAF